MSDVVGCINGCEGPFGVRCSVCNSPRNGGARISADQDYCGCCGNPCRGTFCLRCRKHVLRPNGHRHAWDCTYFAQHNAPCPFDTSFGQSAAP